MNSPGIYTKHLHLREIEQGDRSGIFKNFSDPEIANWFFDQPFTHIEQADQVIREFNEKSRTGKGFTWAILLKETGEFIGTCGYENFEHGSKGEIGFDLAKEQWGKGYMSEALTVIIHHGFQVFKLSRVEAHTYSHNSRARKVLEKLGFKAQSADKDSHYYIISKRDWGRKKP